MTTFRDLTKTGATQALIRAGASLPRIWYLTINDGWSLDGPPDDDTWRTPSQPVPGEILWTNAPKKGATDGDLETAIYHAIKEVSLIWRGGIDRMRQDDAWAARIAEQLLADIDRIRPATPEDVPPPARADTPETVIEQVADTLRRHSGWSGSIPAGSDHCTCRCECGHSIAVPGGIKGAALARYDHRAEVLAAAGLLATTDTAELTARLDLAEIHQQALQTELDQRTQERDGALARVQIRDAALATQSELIAALRTELAEAHELLRDREAQIAHDAPLRAEVVIGTTVVLPADATDAEILAAALDRVAAGDFATLSSDGTGHEITRQEPTDD